MNVSNHHHAAPLPMGTQGATGTSPRGAVVFLESSSDQSRGFVDAESLDQPGVCRVDAWGQGTSHMEKGDGLHALSRVGFKSQPTLSSVRMAFHLHVQSESKAPSPSGVQIPPADLGRERTFIAPCADFRAWGFMFHHPQRSSAWRMGSEQRPRLAHAATRQTRSRRRFSPERDLGIG